MSQALVYFLNAQGHIVIPMTSDAPTPRGFERCSVKSMYEIESVSRRYAAQKQRMFDTLDEAAAQRIEDKMADVRSRLHHKMQTTHSQFEKDFIRYALQRLEEDERQLRIRKYEMHLEMEAKEAPLE